ncbi:MULTISPECIES: rod shape-determining protein MreC [Bacteroidales]|uniref:rod shape-determining protein MreC n=1 Tax=Bacteroidales TaxID=171549 RepID=UPI0014417765|nr:MULTISPECIES: rod shape-determining protein MreC [Bacteroidales]
MRNLLNFIIRYGTWFLFAFYVVLSLVLLFSHNSYHHSVYLSSANVVSSFVNSTVSEITGYFHLRSINESLQASNAMLENEVLNLRHQIAECKTKLSDTVKYEAYPDRFDYISATVVNNSVRHPRNYFSIDKGAADGIKRGMGVVDQNGIVGIVNVTGEHTARVISLLNETQHFSVRLKGTQFIGSLSWKGRDPQIAYVEEMPRHARFQVGDTIVTSGFSTTFPGEIPVGIVMNRVKSSDDNFFVLKVCLTTDFRALSIVRVIKDEYKSSLDSLQNFDFKPDK